MYKNDMLAFAGGERRSGERRDLAVDARAHSFEKRPCRVHVSNLSPRGCQLDASSHTKIQGLIYLDFAGLPLIGAKIVWLDEYHAGCEFVTPLTPDEFEVLSQSDWSSEPADRGKASGQKTPCAMARHTS
ncbi:PilZ domain-containing protein [Parasphingopyxis lamellibrachiae]|uniref:PilZ domain-containing protein n=1 Tax=Parasphingopyxis lamellibrachiae TaxID=680125 RepID=A0A3D9FGC5_9SPHN|nr:PilZ domain-containing protein [Parasphingopyxis lamellibrachiae]RED16587.1 PilZ domain-containing protein [Parasphingopyxis lamellibrachiae]